MKYVGFVYLWRDRLRKMYYLGSHLGRENDGYVGSSKWFLSAYRKRPQDFKRRIIKRIYDDETLIRKIEHQWLQMIKINEIGVRYYNLNRYGKGVSRELASAGGKTAMAKAHIDKNEDGKSIFALMGSEAAHRLKDENGKSINSLKALRVLHEIKDENGKSVEAVMAGYAASIEKDENGKSVRAVRAATTLHSIKNEDGKSAAGVKGAAVMNQAKDENGKSMASVKGGRTAGKLVSARKDSSGRNILAVQGASAVHSIKNEEGKSIHAIEIGRKGREIRWRKYHELKAAMLALDEVR